MHLEHITTQGERWDTLSYRYYGYPRIIAANPHIPIVPLLPSGLVVLIPIIEQAEASKAEDTPPWLR
ncbi:tail protein X [Pectobacterium brasiliense]|uniref:tail protein X n=1 Tax=Pectobacterium brasiliense TaxID=180957 RepID=UPI001968DAD6|nr:tail protein X [Pectobacterium brasiliense]MBN3264580.1 tail protein X [Pectobacterium brasiliense]